MAGSDKPQDKTRDAADDDELLKEIRDRYTYGTNQWREIREEGQKDMLCLAGQPWEALDPEGLKERDEKNRPALALDELTQYTNQLINDARANKRGIKVSPAGYGATEQTAQFRANKIREIEYRSKASQVYIAALENSSQRGYGFFRVKPKWVDDRSFDQELILEAFPNPDLVTPDPDHLMTDGSDMQFCFVEESRLISDFGRDFPNATVQSFTDDHRKLAPGWLKGNRITVAEYWKLKTTRRHLYELKPISDQRPQAGAVLGLAAPSAGTQMLFEDELPKGAALPADRIIRDRWVDAKSVCNYLTNGLEILQSTEMPGRFIPIVTCYGKILFLEEKGEVKRKLLSLIRLARDPYMLYCYIRTCEAEAIGGVPRSSFIGYKGQFRGVEGEWERANNEPVPFLEAEATVEKTGNQVLPLPQKQPWDPPLQNLEIAADSARRAIMSAIGSTPLPTAAQRRNEKSGVALQHMDEQAQRGSFHFIDHFNDAIEQAGRIIDDWIDPYYGQQNREVAIRTEQGESQLVKVNAGGQSPNTKQGRHDVTISTGPSFDSEREAAKDTAASLSQNPQVFPLIASELVRLQNLGPIGDQIADILDTLKPPELRQMLDAKQQTQALDPKQAAAIIAGLKRQLAQVMHAAQGMQEEIKTQGAKQRATVATAGINARKEILLQKMKDATSIAVAKIQAMTKGVASANEAQVEAIALDHEAEQNALDRAHDVNILAQEHQNSMDAADQGLLGDLTMQANQPPDQPAAPA